MANKFDKYFNLNYWSNNKYDFLKSRLYIKAHIKFNIEVDKRLKFYDLSLIEYDKRKPKCEILQIYSSVNNIGNYLPVLGIQKMLGFETDTWNIHDKNIDFDFINKNYKAIIVGGAGLLNYCFTPFWEKFSKFNKLPWVLWGVGGCYPDGDVEKGVKYNFVKKSLENCLLVNVRDYFTADLYNMKDAFITSCPSIIYLQDKFKGLNIRKKGKKILYSSHEELLDIKETNKIHKKMKEIFGIKYIYTNNIQDKYYGLEDIIRLYTKSKLVVTSRLHGAIISYGLGIPYIAIPRDVKLREFNKIYGNGLAIENIDDLKLVMNYDYIFNNTSLKENINFEPVLQFGKIAKNKLLNL